MTMTTADYRKQAANEMASAAIKAGYRAFMAESGTYGFFTNEAGDRVVSFQGEIFESSVSGNYKTNMPKKTGNGWGITKDFDPEKMDDYFQASAPRWAVGSAQWEFTTLEQHLATYQASSKYQEITNG